MCVPLKYFKFVFFLTKHLQNRFFKIYFYIYLYLAISMFSGWQPPSALPCWHIATLGITHAHDLQIKRLINALFQKFARGQILNWAPLRHQSLLVQCVAVTPKMSHISSHSPVQCGIQGLTVGQWDDQLGKGSIWIGFNWQIFHNNCYFLGIFTAAEVLE